MNVMAVVEHLKAANKQIIGVSMGKIGRITRILGPQVGSYLTYASLERGKESADGQLTIAETKTIWEILQG
jgi:3-dehydroquinate dehydratase type I